jgi:hypothetical protein
MQEASLCLSAMVPAMTSSYARPRFLTRPQLLVSRSASAAEDGP